MVYSDNYKNFNEVFSVIEENTPADKVMIQYMIRKRVVEVTAEQFFNDLKEVSSVFIRLGLNGKAVGIIGRNSYQWALQYCALLNVGCIAVAMSSDYRAKEIEDAAVRTNMSAVLFDDALENTLLECHFTQPVSLINMTSSEKNGILSMTSERTKGLVDIICETGSEEIGTILFTSGTTGGSKAVALSNKALIYNALHPFIRNEYTSILVILPFHHVAGQGLIINTIGLGDVLCIGESPAHLMKCLVSMEPEGIFTVPSLCAVMEQKLRNAKEGEYPLGKKLKMLMCGGAKFQPALLDTFLKRNIHVYQTYGATETGGRGTYCLMGPENIGVLGRLEPICKGKIQDGELLLSVPTMMDGYYGEPDKTEEALKDGWYHTGDAATIADNGYIYLTGRIKNLIILANGENVSPEEIESVVGMNSEISEILVHEEENQIGAVIYPEYPENASEEDKMIIKDKIHKLVEMYNDSTVSYKQIRRITIVEEPLAKTNTGKIIRY